MNFYGVTGQTSTEDAKKIIDSIFSRIPYPTFVTDNSTFEILYQNKRAIDLTGNKLGHTCHDVFYTCDIPCIDCPFGRIGQEPISVVRRNELLDKNVKWQFTNIRWFDNREAVLGIMQDMDAEISNVELEHRVKIDVDSTNKNLDELTQIPNYLRFYANAEKDISVNGDAKYAIVVFDIDRLKSINDLYGMSGGDETLKHVANTLRDLFGSEENYARLHSDFFSFYMKYEKKGDIIKTIEKLRKKIADNDFEYDINTSFGIYLVNDRVVPINLMCDRAMMASTTAKGNVIRFCAFYDEQYREDMIKASQIEGDMGKALKNHEFKMYLQPKYRLINAELCGAEVLARWIHPLKGIISPVDFVPLFEKNGFILKLDEYMWEEACKALRSWIDAGRRPVPLSVNISRYHIRHNNLEHVLRKLLEKYRLTPDLLHLEITESLFLDKPEELNRVLVRLSKMGFKLEVDDFGSGYSSLNLIRNISVDTIKIDKDFLDSEMASEKGKIVVNHTIDMAKDLNLQVVAEGVETKEHVEFLRNSNCDIAQGFYFSKPMPLEEFNKLDF